MTISVLFIHQDGNITGSAISLRNLLMGFDRQHVQPHVLLGAEGKARQLYETLDVPVDVIPMRFYGTAPGAHWFESSYYLNWLALRPNPLLSEFLKNKSPDIVHVNDKSMLAAGRLVAKSGFPVVWHLRSSYNASYSKLQAWVSKKNIRNYATRLIAISEDECDGFEDLKNLSVIHNSVDFITADQAISSRTQTRTTLGISTHEIAIGMVGHLSEVRGAWDFIEIAGQVQKALPSLSLRFVLLAPIPSRTQRSLGWREFMGLVDSRHPEDKAKDLAAKAGVSQNLLITGYRNDPLAVIASMDILVSCSHYGVMGRPPFEAMSVGTPVVAWAGHSGKSRVLVNEETALIVKRWDKAAATNAIIRLACNEDLRMAMGKRGLEYSRIHFDPFRNARAVQQIYSEIMSERKDVRS